jgi:FkbM family methyltransferase
MNTYTDIILSKTTINPNSVLEIGSRDGHDAEYLRSFFRVLKSNVFVVEPNPEQFKKIKNSYPEFNLYQSAIYNKTGVMKFNAVRDESLIGVSSLLERNDDIYSKINSEQIEVQVITGQELLNQINQPSIDICKVDVEGATYEVLESFGDSIESILSFHLECEHYQVWTNQKLYDDISKFLLEKGFEQVFFEYVNGVKQQSDSIWVSKKYIK